MDGLLIDFELFWDCVELDVMVSLGVDIIWCYELLDMFGLCIDMVVDFWFV